MRKREICPSLLAADFSNLDKELNELKTCDIKIIHFDVMDGQFVKNISFGIPVLKSLKNAGYPFIYDVHLMILNPYDYVEEFIKSGADVVTIHYETCTKKEIIKICRLVHKLNKKVGLAIKPRTSILEIKKFLHEVDLVLVMSVEPGFGGQEFNGKAIKKIKWLQEYRISKKMKYLIEVDGGINDITSKKCIQAGADLLVAGSYIFNAKNRKEAIFNLSRF